MFKRNVFKILAIVFFLLAGASFYNSNKIKPVLVKKIISPTKILTPTIFLTGIARNAPTPEPTQIIIPTSIIKGSENPTPTNDISNGSVTPDPYISVSLSINGSSVGSFEILQGSNQCDVLTQALSQGKIQSLNMRYNNDMGTNAVYQINGIGKENTVWWGFKVNGQSPSQGCSYIKVNDGDNVLWEYVGN